MIGDSFLNIGAGVTVRSISGNPADVVLDANKLGRVALFPDGPSGWLIGFTVTNGLVSNEGGGIFQGCASNCIITGNDGGEGGGGVSETFLWNCTVEGNRTTVFGGGCMLSPLYNCKIIGNVCTGVSLYAGSGGGAADCSVYNCLVVSNKSGFKGGGISGAGTLEIHNTTIIGNTVTSIYAEGGGVYGPIMINSISRGNSPADWWDGDPQDFTFYSCGVGYTGPGSITNDPLLNTSFHLQAGSPCINTGTNDSWTIGAKDLDGKDRIYPVGGTVDMGAFEYYPPAAGKYFIWRKP
jgi:hypothetical protein